MTLVCTYCDSGKAMDTVNSSDTDSEESTVNFTEDTLDVSSIIADYDELSSHPFPEPEQNIEMEDDRHSHDDINDALLFPSTNLGSRLTVDTGLSKNSNLRISDSEEGLASDDYIDITASQSLTDESTISATTSSSASHNLSRKKNKTQSEIQTSM